MLPLASVVWAVAVLSLLERDLATVCTCDLCVGERDGHMRLVTSRYVPVLNVWDAWCQSPSLLATSRMGTLVYVAGAVLLRPLGQRGSSRHALPCCKHMTEWGLYGRVVWQHVAVAHWCIAAHELHGEKRVTT